MPEQQIGSYSILQEIASGTQGAVYRAFDTGSGRIVALKVLHASLRTDRNYLERFHREATITSSIDHPNVVKIYEVGEGDGNHFIAMEFLPESLSRVIESSGRLPVNAAVSFAAQIADGLAVRPHNWRKGEFVNGMGTGCWNRESNRRSREHADVLCHRLGHRA
jgi:serine/threonine protein kinase